MTRRGGDALVREQIALNKLVGQAITTTLANWKREQLAGGKDSRLVTQAMLAGLGLTLAKIIADKAGLSDSDHHELQQWMRVTVQNKIEEYLL
jgi:hypothetical protein